MEVNREQERRHQEWLKRALTPRPVNFVDWLKPMYIKDITITVVCECKESLVLNGDDLVQCSCGRSFRGNLDWGKLVVMASRAADDIMMVRGIEQ